MNTFATPFSLAGQFALITGASRGIGQAIAISFAEAGAHVLLCGRSAQSLEATAAQIKSQGGQCSVEAADVACSDSRNQLFERIAERYGHLDILVNNAGVEEVKASLEVDEATWDRIMDTNLKGAFFCAQGAAKLMSGRQGAILNLCSLTSEVGVPGATPYGSSKTGMLGMTRALATEWAKLGIRVNGIGPGYFQTELTATFYEDPDWRERMMQKIPLERFGQLQDLTGAALFLCSPAASYITGQVLYVDGGYLASI